MKHMCVFEMKQLLITHLQYKKNSLLSFLTVFFCWVQICEPLKMHKRGNMLKSVSSPAAVLHLCSPSA
jgi:hypothetical protein